MKQTLSLGILAANTLANYILKHFGPMSHLKLQKLLFYCEAYHLAYFDESLIEEEFQAWVHGPVCKEVYNSLKDTSILYSDIAFDKSSDKNPDIEVEQILNSSQKELIVDVLRELSTWTGLELEEATHNEKPWIEARNGISPSHSSSNIISKNTMKLFYQQELGKNG
jgi:uncharacterized phage-associated protein